MYIIVVSRGQLILKSGLLVTIMTTFTSAATKKVIQNVVDIFAILFKAD
jgi:hypothetical protein